MGNEEVNGMAQKDEEFIKEIEGDFKRLSELFEGKVKKRLTPDSPLLQEVNDLDKTQGGIKDKIEGLKQRTEPIESETKEELIDKINKFERDIAPIKEGLDVALRLELPSPSLRAWIWFAVEILMVIAAVVLYLNMHADRPVQAFLQGIKPEHRVELAAKVSAIETRALLLDHLREGATGEDEVMQSLKAAMSANLEEANMTFKAAGFSPSNQAIFQKNYDKIKAELEADTPIGKVIVVYLDQIYEDVLKQEEPFFWDRGLGRYIEVLFASFFGAMGFTLYNWWEHMRKPFRGWWVAWHLAKIFLALVFSFSFIAILSQVNFATPESLETQTALGLGTAPIELVIAVSILSGYFSHRTLSFLDKYANRIFGLASVP
jgi:hypothetical protein